MSDIVERLQELECWCPVSEWSEAANEILRLRELLCWVAYNLWIVDQDRRISTDPDDPSLVAVEKLIPDYFAAGAKIDERYWEMKE